MENQFLIKSLKSRIKELELENETLKTRQGIFTLKENIRKENNEIKLKLSQSESKRYFFEVRLEKLNEEIFNLTQKIIIIEDKLYDSIKDSQRLITEKNKLKKENSYLKTKKINKNLKDEVRKLKAKLKEKDKEMEILKAELGSQKIINQNLEGQNSKNSNNSSIPSSKEGFKKTVQNNRVKSGKSIGGQKGHVGYCAPIEKKVDEVIECNLSVDYPDYENFEKTDKYIVKQVVDIIIKKIVTEYREYEYVNKITGKIVYAKNELGITSRVTYGDNIKAISLLINDFSNVSIDKTRTLLSLFTNEEIKLTNSTIHNFKKEFNKKSEDEYKDLISELLNQKELCIDHTGVNVGGKNNNLLFIGNDKVSLYAAVETKGIDDITPFLEHYAETLIHDHASSFRRFGKRHQECTAHILRSLRFVNEVLGFEWGGKMRELIQRLIHERKEKIEKGKASHSKTYIKKAITDYNRVLKLGKKELAKQIKNKYNKESFNLYKMLDDYKTDVLYFLENFNVPASSNLAERKLRVSKTKMKVSSLFQTLDNAKMYAKFLSIVETLRSKKENILIGIKNIFSKPKLKLE